MDMDRFKFSCFKCRKHFFSYKTLIRHIKVSYPYLDKYQCSQCNRYFSDISGLRKHYVTDHSESKWSPQLCGDIKKSTDLPTNCFTDNTSTSLELCDTKETNHIHTITPSVTNFIVQYISKLYSNPSFSRNLVQTVIDSSQELINNIFSIISTRYNQNQSHVTNNYNTFQTIFLEVDNTFSRLQTEYLRLQFFENSSAYIRPKEFNIGTSSVLTNIDSTTPPDLIIKQVQGQKICIKKKLKQFLELPNVFTKIVEYINNEVSSQNVITSIYQGIIWKKIQSNFFPKTVFPLLLFFDDLEPCNVLGSRAGLYKLGTVYISLACIPQEYASLLENIFLAQLFYSHDRQTFGNKKVFKDLINDLLFLENEGLTIHIESKPHQIFFTLFLILGDNLGLNSILGFTESFNADYCCRICLSPKILTKFETNDSKFIQRTPENYTTHSTNLNYGIKEKCIWHVLPNFHVTKNISCDLMHDFFEGVLRYDMAYLINDFIKKNTYL